MREGLRYVAASGFAADTPSGPFDAKLPQGFHHKISATFPLAAAVIRAI